MDYPVLAGCGLTRSDAAKVLPPVLLVCQRGCKQSANPLQAYWSIWEATSWMWLERHPQDPPSQQYSMGNGLSHAQCIIQDSSGMLMSYICSFLCLKDYQAIILFIASADHRYGPITTIWCDGQVMKHLLWSAFTLSQIDWEWVLEVCEILAVYDHSNTQFELLTLTIQDSNWIQQTFSAEKRPTLWPALPAIEELQTAWEAEHDNPHCYSISTHTYLATSLYLCLHVSKEKVRSASAGVRREAFDLAICLKCLFV